MNILFDKAKARTYNRFSKLPLGNVIAKGWLKDQLIRSYAGMGGNLDKLEPDMIANAFTSHSSFKTFRGNPADPTFAAGWSSEISGTYWTGLTELAFTLDDEEAKNRVTNWVDAVLHNQDEDGYLGGYSKETDRFADYNSWGSNWCYRALLAYYEASGREGVLEAVYKGLLWFCENWKNHKTDYAGPTIIESMIIVYSYTGDKRLVRFCKDWLLWLEDNSRHQNKISQYLSDRLPYGSMHTVAYGENVKHPAIVWCATGEERLLNASLNGMDKALKKIVFPIGGAGSNTEHLSPVSSDGEIEYCNFSTFNHTYGWMAMVTGQSRWGDEIERCIFNGAQGARMKDERAIAYFTSPNQIKATRSSAIYATWVDNEVYAPCYYVACCPAQSVRTVPEYVRSMCLTDREDNLFLLCYGPCDIRSKKLDITQDTMYPFRENITFKINRAEDNAKLCLRIPEWCKNAAAIVGSKNIPLKADELGFACLDSKLKTGDEITVHFPMAPMLHKADDADASSKFPMYITRGPLVFAIPVDVRWENYEGDPITPLPENWNWFEAFPDVNDFHSASFNSAIDENLTEDALNVEELDVDGYVWEKPPVTITLPLRRTLYNHLDCSLRTYQHYGSELETEDKDVMTKLVPYGCTNLRITFIPRGKK